MYAALLIRGIIVLGLTLSFAPSTSRAQVVNADYVEIVKRYMPRPAFSVLLSRGDGTLRINEIEVPDTLRVGESGTFAIQTNIESAVTPFAAQWHFGDGNIARGLVARHAYDAPGRYDVRIAIENGRGRVARALSVVVLPSDAAEPAAP